MKIKNTSRFIAFALVVMMIVPLIGVPTFAAEYEEEIPSVYYDNDFESYVLDASTEDEPDPDGDPNAYIVGADDYFAGNPNSGKDTPVNKVVKDPAGGDNQVFQAELCEGNRNNNNIKAKVDEISYEIVDYVLFETDVYIPSGTVGKVQWQYGCANTGAGWNYLFYIYMNADTTDSATGAVTPGKAYIDNGVHLNAAVAYSSKLQLSRNAWHTISYLMNLDTGLFNLLVDGELAAAGTMGGSLSEITTLPDRLHFAKLDTSSTNAKGMLYIDNMSVTVAEEGPVRPPLYDNDFEAIDLTKPNYDYDGDGTNDSHEMVAADGFKANPGTGNVAVADPKNPENVVWKVPMGVSKEGVDNTNNLNQSLGVSPSYKTYPNILLEFDLYFSADATGRTQYQFVTTDSGWAVLFNIDVTNSKIIVGSGWMATVGKSLTLSREEWHSVGYALNMVTGDWEMFLDNEFVAFGSLGISNISVKQGFIIMNKVETGHAGNGYMMLDNIKVGDGLKPDGATGGVDSYEPSWYSEDFEEFADGDNISHLFPNRKAFSGAYENYFAADVNGDKAWKREMNPAFNDAWSYLGTPLVSYKFTEKVVIESSYYLPTGATGYFVAQAFGSNTGPEGKPGSAWMHLYGVDVTNGKLKKYNNNDLFEVVNEDATILARDEWVKVTYIINLVYGDFDIFVGNAHAATGKLATGYTKITFSEGYIDVCNAANLTNEAYIPAEGSYIYVDDVSVTAYANQVVDYVNIKEDLVSATINGEEIALGGKYLLGAEDVYEEILFDRAKYTAMLGDITAEIRLCTDDGLRFKTEIDKDVLAEMAAEEYNVSGLTMGTIIIPADYLEDPSVITFKLLDDLGMEEGKDYLNVVAKDCYEDEDGTYIAGSILNLQEGNYARDFVAVSYVQMTLPLGNTSTVYGEVCAPASAAWTAFEIVDAAVDGDYLPEEMAILEKFKVAAE